MALTSGLFSTRAMEMAFGDRARLQGMLDFEAALARVQAEMGLIPAAAAASIASACDADRLSLDELSARAAQAGNLAIPLVEALRRAVAVDDPQAASFVHWGATSQDAIDTGLVLQVGRAAPLLLADLDRLARALAMLAREHRGTLMTGRTWLQAAPPVTLGLKAAGVLDALRRVRARVAEAAEAARVLQFGGASGTLASLGPDGLAVAAALARALDLAPPPIPWHAYRDRIADLGAALALACGVLGKLARDLSLLMQTEVGEAFEPAAPGKGGSSTMPNKRNPVGCSVALAAATRAPGLAATLLAALPQEHERGLGGWQAEWETLPELFRLAAGSAASMREAIEGLEVDRARMRANLDLTLGLPMAEAVSMALVPTLGRERSHAVVAAASRTAVATGRPLREVLATDPEVAALTNGATLDRLVDPARYLGAAGAFVDAVLAQGGDHDG